MHNKRTVPIITRLFVLLFPMLAIVSLVSTSIRGTAQEVKVKKVPITQSDSASGKKMYIDYCAPVAVSLEKEMVRPLLL